MVSTHVKHLNSVGTRILCMQWGQNMNTIAHPSKFIVMVPRHILKGAKLEAKRFPYAFFVCCEFSAGVWMVVVDEYTTAIKSLLLHNNSAYHQYNLSY